MTAENPREQQRADSETAGQNGPDDRELDPEEATDAFETREQADAQKRRSDQERQDEDHITLDTPD